MGIAIDAVTIAISMLVAWFIRFSSGFMLVEGWHLSMSQYMRPSIILIPLYLVLYNVFKLYVPQRRNTMVREISAVIKANILGVLIFTLGLFLAKQIHYSRYFIMIFAMVNVTLTILERVSLRLILRRLRKDGKNLKHILLVGYSNTSTELIEKINKNKYWGYNVVGILDDSLCSKEIDKNFDNISEILVTSLEQAAATVYEEFTTDDLKEKYQRERSEEKLNYYKYKSKIIGKMDRLTTLLSKCDIDEVFITLSIKDYDKIEKIINICEKNGVRAQIVPDYYKYLPAKPHIEDVEGLPIINIRYIPLDDIFNKFIKRAIDIVGSLVAIILFSPVMLVAAIGTKISSPGPLIFKQERVGLNKKNFTMYKFRSMRVQDSKEEKKEWTTTNDPRKTKVGSFLRKTSIDELPQLFNVLKGDMSLIGPRPERPFFVEKFKEEIPKYMVKHQVRPGMTGWAQVNGFRGDTSIKKRIEHDIYYIENWSIGLDVKIAFLTVFKGFVNKNAY